VTVKKYNDLCTGGLIVLPTFSHKNQKTADERREQAAPTSMMAPLSSNPVEMDSSCIDDVFLFEPLKMELEAAFLEPIVFLPPEVNYRRSGVRFQANETVINSGTEYYTDEDVQIKWYSNEDLAQIKLNAKELSNELRRSTSPQDASLTEAHRKTTLMLKSDFKKLIKLSPSTPDQDLTNWCSYNDGRRGLERFACRDYTMLRRNDIANTRQAVLEGSRSKKTPESIAQDAREASRRARTFARFFAAADSEAAKTPAVSPGRRMPARCVSMRPGATTAPFSNSTPLRTSCTFTKSKLPPLSRGVPIRSKSMRPADLAAPPSRCAPARKRSKQCHSNDLFGEVR